MANKDFLSTIRNFTSNTQIDIAETAASTTRDLFKAIVQRSPHDTGRFIANWQVGATDVSFSVPSTTSYANKLSEINYTITDDFFLRNNKAYLVNNVSYGKNIEDIGWTFTPAYAPVATSVSMFIGKVA